MTLISVIIPFHNRLEWTCQAIKSVLCQTMQDFEIILIDDGSTDDLSRLSSYLQNKKINYIRQENKGVASARNRGLENASGEFIAFLDSDDLYFPDKLERQLLAMRQYPLIPLSHTSYNRMDKTGKYIEQMHSGKFSGKVYPEIYTFCPIATPTVMIRRAVYVENHLRFEEKISIAEDIVFWTEFAKRSDILGIDEPLTKVRIDDQSAFSDYQKQIVGFKNILKYGIEKDTFLNTKQKRIILASCYSLISSLYLRESEISVSVNYSIWAIQESFFTWVKMLFKVKKIIRIFRIFTSEISRSSRYIWRKFKPKEEIK